MSGCTEAQFAVFNEIFCTVNTLKFQTLFSLSVLKRNVGYQGWNSQNACQISKQGRPCPDCSFKHLNILYYPPTKSEGYSFGVVRVHVRPFRPSTLFCPSGTISQYLLVRFDSFWVKMISTMESRYHRSLVKMDPLTLE